MKPAQTPMQSASASEQDRRDSSLALRHVRMQIRWSVPPSQVFLQTRSTRPASPVQPCASDLQPLTQPVSIGSTQTAPQSVFAVEQLPRKALAAARAAVSHAELSAAQSLSQFVQAVWH